MDRLQLKAWTDTFLALLPQRSSTRPSYLYKPAYTNLAYKHMPERLPAELVGAILQEAVELFVASDRHTAVSVALTSKFIYRLVRPILFRRLVVTHDNESEIEGLLLRNDINDLILDLCLAQNEWDPGPISPTFTRLQCIRGYTEASIKALEGLPPSSQSSLRKLQLWRWLPLTGVKIPPSVTHLCLYNSDIEHPQSEIVASWVAAVPALTHLGLEYVRCEPVSFGSHDRESEPEELAHGLEIAIQACGAHLQQLAMRFCVDTSEGWWQQFLDALRARARKDSSGLDAMRKIRIWRDERVPMDLDQDLAQSARDFHGGVDVWSEGRSLSEL